MPYTERHSCRFDLHPDGEDHPSRLYLDVDQSGSLLAHKLVGRMFLEFRPGVSWAAADELVSEMREKLTNLHIVHLAPGE
jgi:hypothetical protein